MSSPIYRHKKTDGLYEIIYRGHLQIQDNPMDNQEAVVYRQLADGSIWIRPLPEFFDGRFESLEAITHV